MREYSPAYLPNTVNNLNEIKKKTDCDMDRSRSTIYHTKRNTLSTHDPQLSSSFNFNEIKPALSRCVRNPYLEFNCTEIQSALSRCMVILVLNLISMRLNQHSAGVFGVQNLLFRILIVIFVLNLISMRLNPNR